MRPTLEAGDTIFVAKWPFGLRFPWSTSPMTSGSTPQVGDVVIFSSPQEPTRDFIKRVVALPGDTVEIRKGHLLINGKNAVIQRDPHGTCGTETLPHHGQRQSHGVCWEPPQMEDFGPEKIPANHVFVIGDLRTGEPKTDDPKTRNWGAVPVPLLKGRALWIWLSVEPRSFEHPTFFPHFRFERMFRRIK